MDTPQERSRMDAWDVQKFLLQEAAMNLLWMLWVHKDKLRWTQQSMWWVR